VVCFFRLSWPFCFARREIWGPFRKHGRLPGKKLSMLGRLGTVSPSLFPPFPGQCRWWLIGCLPRATNVPSLFHRSRGSVSPWATTSTVGTMKKRRKNRPRDGRLGHYDFPPLHQICWAGLRQKGGPRGPRDGSPNHHGPGRGGPLPGGNSGGKGRRGRVRPFFSKKPPLAHRASCPNRGRKGRIFQFHSGQSTEEPARGPSGSGLFSAGSTTAFV